MKAAVISLLQAVFCLFLAGTALSGPPERIVSLAPNMTEILYALGLENRIIGVTDMCTHPPEAREKPKVGGVVNPSFETLLEMDPDIVVMTVDVNPAEFKERLKGLGIRTYVFPVRRLAELPQGIRDLGAVLGAEERADALAGEIEGALRKYAQESSTSPEEKKAVYIVWPEPLIVAGPGTVVDDALRLLGWGNIASDSPVRYPKFSIEEVIRRAPDVILIDSRHTGDMEEVSKRLLDRLGMLEAVRQGRIFYTSDAVYMLGPRIVDGLEELSTHLK
jgi:iron complex transport system substrate-binding protein